MEAYLAELERARRFHIAIMQSNGGFLSAGDARRHAVRTVLSGPAGGVVGAMETARRSGFRKDPGLRHGRHVHRCEPGRRRRARNHRSIRRRLSDSRPDARHSHRGRGRRLHRARGCGRAASRRSGERGRRSRPGLLRHRDGAHRHRRARGAGPHSVAARRRDARGCGSGRRRRRSHCAPLESRSGRCGGGHPARRQLQHGAGDSRGLGRTRLRSPRVRAGGFRRMRRPARLRDRGAVGDSAR